MKTSKGINQAMRNMHSALAKYSGAIPISIRRHWRDGWIAELPSSITASGGVAARSSFRLCNWGHKPSKAALLLDLCQRYGGHYYLSGDTAFINPRHVLHHPNWGGSRYGGLPELAQAMKLAGLI